MEDHNGHTTHIFSAVSGSARQLVHLLRCINFKSKAHVHITREGIRFAVEEAQVMQGIAFLDKSLFTAYTYTPPARANGNKGSDSEDEDEEPEIPPFQIPLSSLLETLQIFGINDTTTKDRWSTRNNVTHRSSALETRAVLGMTGLCRLSYASPGDPLCIILEETGVTTTCELTTYEPDSHEEIPLQKDAIAQKIIMRASWLHDAIIELSSTSPTRLTIVSSPTAPYFTLSSTGPLGSATVEFSKDPQLLETFHVPRRTVNTYKYSLIKGASRAMASATKVSVRSDEQGVLSLQFMIEVEPRPGFGGVAFVDFRFVPFLPEAGEDDEDSGGDEELDEGICDGR
ncbi:MAG: hypothetical protein Q9217_006705 [Psora testacea]